MELLEGRVIILGDGSPLALVVPALFIQFFQASEDYCDRTTPSSFIRALRFIAFFIAVSLPAIYIALVSFQPELIPIDLMVPLARARKEVPFPVVLEVLLQEGIIQVAIEAGLRFPGPVGQTVGVVAGSLSLPRVVSTGAGQDAWIAVLIGTLVPLFPCT